MARSDQDRPAAVGPRTVHQQMLAEIEAALSANDPAVAAMHVRLATTHARRCADCLPVAPARRAA